MIVLFTAVDFTSVWALALATVRYFTVRFHAGMGCLQTVYVVPYVLLLLYVSALVIW
jgi:hypothetical protein